MKPEELFNQDYTYNIYQLDFPSLDFILEDTLEFENQDNIGAIRFIKGFLTTYTILNTQKSNLNNPEWCDDVLVIQADLAEIFTSLTAGQKSYIIKRNLEL